MKRMPILGACLALLATTLSAADAPLRITAEGFVAHAGAISIPAGSRYADAGIAAAPTSEAYVLGAALLRPSLVDGQTRLRAGVVYNFSEIARAAGERGDDALMNRAMQLAAWLRTLPVTGRRVALLDPRVAEITPDANLPIEHGDVLRYPTRPSTIRIVGAVAESCELPFVPMQDARHYLASCPADHVADKNDFFVIQPDSKVIRLGRAPWNRGEAQSLAPGAVIYVPITTAASASVDAELDQEVATFLGTQVLP